MAWPTAPGGRAAAAATPTFGEHQRQLEASKGRRLLRQVAGEPEATYEQWAARWEDMGSPAYRHPSQPAPGHVVCLTWDSAIPKFGIDRAAGVWPDYGNPDRFRLSFGFVKLGPELVKTWKGQRLTDGLPIITTVIERDGLRYEVEQFAYPLDGPPKRRRGDIAMVLLSRVKVTSLSGEAQAAVIAIHHRREHTANKPLAAAARSVDGGGTTLEGGGHVLLAVQGAGLATTSCEFRDAPIKANDPKALWAADGTLTVGLDLPAGGSREIVVKLPSPAAPASEREKLLALDYAACRGGTVKFWSDWLARGAQFRVPDQAVNALFRANLWHGLRLPRRHGADEPGVRIDLPYSNFAYDQHGTPWPVNQAVYVDYMLYGLRGYADVAWEELRAVYRGNQQADGRVGGYANWGVYTPSMVYAVARCFLLSQDRKGFDTVLPQTLKAADWCLGELRKASASNGPAAGLVRAPLNDLTGEGVSAFNQAYLYAGLHELGRALERIDHPRARLSADAAETFAVAVRRAFAAAAVRSPLVQLRDHTWTPYVPCDVTRPGRLLDVWYPTDVDTGAVHLLRLGALPASGHLAECLLNDHEDNLFLHGWGMANEPVYNQQAMAYLLRDDVQAAIRAFYSMMACAFSHSAFEPVEHRWSWGQYFGPPSTDGAWFELYRNMLIREGEDGSLLLGQATPRKWLADGKSMEIERAPTFYGPLSLTVRSAAAAGTITAEVDAPQAVPPDALLLRLRHPEAKPIKAVTVNGQPWNDFDVRNEWVTIPKPRERHYKVVASY
jgi:hypothetical protein